MHYGHIEHLREAKEQGDILVVSVTAARFVNKGPGRPYFSDEQRLSFLASIEYVDYVLLSEAVTVHAIVKIVQPDIYVKGSEYAVDSNDITGNIGAERDIVEQYGGKIYFTQGEVFSSTKLLNNFFDALPDDVVETSRRLQKKYGANIAEQIRRQIDDFSSLKVLVIGDIIIDEYVFCNVQGVTMKDSALSTRFDYTERYVGGALAIARHIANFVDKVTFLSMMDYDADIADLVVNKMHGIECRIVQDGHFVTPVKKRYLRQNPIRQEYDKLFSVNRLLTVDDLQTINYDNFYRNLEEMLPNYDVVVVCDYGHGLFDEYSVKTIERNAKFLAVNCQVNSANYGMNVITKYSRADTFVVDERELRLPFGQNHERLQLLLPKLKNKLGSRYAWLTMGAQGALGVKDDEAVQIPAVTLRVKDTVGAGDAFYSLAALSAVSDMPLDQATLVCNIAGAIKTNVVGNSTAVPKVDLLKFLGTVLNV